MNSIQITSGYQLQELISKVMNQMEKDLEENKKQWKPLYEIINKVLAESNLEIQWLQDQIIPFMFKGNVGIKFKDASLRFTVWWHRESIIKELNNYPKIKMKITNIIFC